MGGSNIYRKTVTASTAAIDADILDDPYVVTADDVAPGGGAVIRIYFSLEFTGAATGTIEVTNNGNLKGLLNSDNSGTIVSNGIYRFDIDVELGDSINIIPSTVAVTTVNYVRLHLVQWGA